MQNMASLFENVVIEPCLLHGDLWSGNIAYDTNSEPVILDPACYCISFHSQILDIFTIFKHRFDLIPPQMGITRRILECRGAQDLENLSTMPISRFSSFSLSFCIN